MSVPPTPLLSGRGLRMRFGGFEAVKGVDIDLWPGEVHAIVGENGAGKSTVAKMLAGVYVPTVGEVIADGKKAHFGSPRQALEHGIALIHQEPLTFPDLSVAENIFVGHQPVRGGRIDWKAMQTRASELLQTLGANFNAQARAGGLSVADQQTIELAAALAHNARVLFLDETTAAITPKEVESLFSVVRRLRDEGRALAFVSHRLDEVFAISDRITVMRDGEKVAELRTSETTPAEIVRWMVGRDVKPSTHVSTSRAGTEPLLKVRDLTRKGVFEGVSFDVCPGEIVGLAGLVGAGRTEVCEAIFGVTQPDSGSVELAGERIRLRSPGEAVKKGLAMVPEDRQHHGLLLPLSIAANVTLPTLRGAWRSPKGEKRDAEAKMSGIRTAMRGVNQRVGELSGGNQQKVVIAKWLATKPKLLILDEPTRGVDVGAKEEVHALIRELVASGLSILMVSSDLPEILDLSDRVLVLRAGRVTAELNREEATPERVMAAAAGAHA